MTAIQDDQQSVSNDYKKTEQEFSRIKTLVSRAYEELESFSQEDLSVSDEFKRVVTKRSKNVDAIVSLALNEIRNLSKMLNKSHRKTEKIKQALRSREIECSSFPQEIQGLRQRELVLQNQLELMQKQAKSAKNASHKAAHNL